MSNFKRVVIILAMTVAALCVSAAALQREQYLLSDKLIRLHVVAASDDPADQRLKLQVRDAVLEAAMPLLKDADDPEQVLEMNLDLFYATALETLRENGSEDTVSVSFGKERFPTRIYETFSLPAGIYRSLRITIGEGLGQNWWCVVFPSICVSAACDLEAAAVAAGFSADEVSLITEESPGYVFKFKLLELLDELQQRW